MPRWSAVTGIRIATVVAALTATIATVAVAMPASGSPGSAGVGDSYYPEDGNGGYNVTDYTVGITYDPGTKHLDGDTVVTAVATQNLSRFNLDLDGLTVNSVRVNGAAATFTRAGHELVITPATPVGRGEQLRTQVGYSGEPKILADGLGGMNAGWQISPSGGAFVMGEPHSATAWYPVNDTPSDKATFHLNASVPQEWTVVSIGREVPAAPAPKPGYRTYSWAETTPTIPYLTNIAIDKFEIYRSKLSDGKPVLDAYAPGVDEAAQEAENHLPEIVEFLASKFGPYPFSSAGGIFIAKPSVKYALETQGRPIYGPGMGRLTVVVHEYAHQWFGNSVSFKQWRDICLSECFASYTQQLWDEAKDGKDLDQWYRDEVRSQSGSFWAAKLYDMGRGKEFTGVYQKGPLALHALRRQIGDDKFFSTLKGWQTAHRNGNASWPEFEAYASKQSGQNLGGFFNAWARQGAKPGDAYLWPGPLKP